MNDQPENEINPGEPYIAFIDGSLDFNCKVCTEKDCCKGHGFGGMENRGIGALIDNYPQLLPWIQMREKGHVLLSNPRSGCFFLEQNGLCKIELTQGRQSKPGICLMFPFNRLALIENYFILRPNFLCRHLEPVLPPRPGFVAGSYDNILSDFHATGMANSPRSLIPFNSDEDVNKILSREREFQAACRDALGSERVTETIKYFSKNVPGLLEFNSSALRLLGIDLPQENLNRDHLDDLLHILLPMIRIDHLTFSPEEILRVNLLLESLVRTSFIGVTVIPTLASLFSFINDVRPILAVLGHGEEPYKPLLDWQADRSRPPMDEVDHKMAFGVMIILTGKGYSTLQALEEALSTMTRPFERVLFIRRLASLLKYKHSEGNKIEKNIPQNRK